MNMDPAEFPDKTLSELNEEDREELSVDIDSFHDELDDYRGVMEVVGASIVLAVLFEEDELTLREYIWLTGLVEDYASTLDKQVV